MTTTKFLEKKKKKNLRHQGGVVWWVTLLLAAAAQTLLFAGDVAAAQSNNNETTSCECPSGVCYVDNVEDCVPEWVVDGGFIVLIIILLTMFWALAVTCEEFFVPALNVLCERLKVPDDVAGATFMAAGASSPEVFASLIALFITHSDLGVGTVIGSEVFNMLVICGASVIYAEGGVLKLEWRILARECTFYAIALMALLCVAVVDHCKLKSEGCENDYDETKIQVHWYEAAVLIMLYVAYALVCAYYQTKIVPALCPIATAKDAAYMSEDNCTAIGDDNDDDGQMSAIVDEGGGLSNAMRESLLDADHDDGSADSFAAGDVNDGAGGGGGGDDDDGSRMDRALSSAPPLNPKARAMLHQVPPPKERTESKWIRTGSMASRRASRAMSTVESLAQALMPNMQEALHQTHVSNICESIHESRSMSCYLFKKSRFYSKMRVSSQKWQLRWFTIDADGFFSCLSPEEPGERYKYINIYEATAVRVWNEHFNVFKLYMPKRNIYYRAPTPEIMRDCVRLLKRKIVQHSMLSEEERKGLKRTMKAEVKAATGKTQKADDDEDFESILDVPHSTAGKVLHVFLFPLKLVFHLTIPDVRDSKQEANFSVAIFTSVVWLALLSYVMIAAAEMLGGYLQISSAVMGLTVGAAGTSFPNVFSSMLVARQGFGNMAVSNAFGSNVFNIFIGLGLPWLLYMMFDLGSNDYTELSYNGVVVPIMVLIALLVVFLIVLAVFQMTLTKPLAYVCFISYFVYLVIAIVPGSPMGG